MIFPSAIKQVFRLALLICLSTGFAASNANAQTQKSTESIDASIRTFFSNFCIRCHNAEENDSDIRLDNIKASFLRGPHAETWHDILRVLNKGDMPPESEKQPSAKELDFVTGWIHSKVESAQRESQSTGGEVVLRRLTKYEFNYTLQDLLGIDFDFGKDLPPDPFSPDGFQNSGQSLNISPLQMEIYLDAARLALSKAIVSPVQPDVIRETVSKSYRKKKGKAPNILAPGEEFVARIQKFPRQGKVKIRIKAKTKSVKGSPYPLMSVSIGNKSDVKTAEEWLGACDVRPTNEPAIYEFVTRIEKFPLPGHNPKFPGIMITIRNELDDPSQKPKRPKKKPKDNLDLKAASLEASTIQIESVEFIGPIFETWPPQHHQRILDPNFDPLDSKGVRNLVSRFASRAFRRPATNDEVDLYSRFFEKARVRFATSEEAVRETLAMVLISPQFLYQLEPKRQLSPKRNSEKPLLTQHEFATRLSYFLWSSMPDEKLRTLADRGELLQSDVLLKQVSRMIADPKSDRFVNHFTDQWLNLSGLGRVAINPEYYPNFDDSLKLEMKKETQKFFAFVLREKLSAMNFLESDFAIVNRRLAKHYGLQPPMGSAFEKVKLTANDNRGGLLTHGSILLTNSNGEDSHPVRRAVWLLDRLLDSPPAPPPPDVPALESENPDFAKLSIKEQLEIHRKKEACNNCHRRIDPWGIAFENYDAVGRWRNQVTRKEKRKTRTIEVNAGTQLPSGQKISGMRDLKTVLMKDEKKRFSRALVSKLLAYSLGRTLEITDEKTVVSLSKKFADNQYVLQDLIVDIVQSKPFRSK